MQVLLHLYARISECATLDQGLLLEMHVWKHKKEKKSNL